MSNWDGSERRKGKIVYNDSIVKFLQEKHLENVELLTTIKVNQLNMLNSFNEWKIDFKEHEKRDWKEFDNVDRRFKSIETKIAWYSGAVGVLAIVPNWIFKIFNK